MAGYQRHSLPPREGISAARLRAPGGKRTHRDAHLPVPATVEEWLAQTVIPRARQSEQALAAVGLTPHYYVTKGELTDELGRRVALTDPVDPGGIYTFYKLLPPEQRVPFEIGVLHEDRDLIVVDKPPFLASTPNGRFVRECVVTRLRQDLGEDDVVAIHRLDRVTSGVLVLSRRSETRGAYQSLFQKREVQKRYRALAWLPSGWSPGEPLPLGLEAAGEAQDRRSRLEKTHGEREVREVAGDPNALTSIALERVFEHEGSWAGEFALLPRTGKTHQLRVHMNALGMPLLGDPVYPVDLEPDPYDFTRTLQLLAERIGFIDPLTGAPRSFVSSRVLDPATS